LNFIKIREEFDAPDKEKIVRFAERFGCMELIKKYFDKHGPGKKGNFII
jgi:hypothetical protein